MGPSIFRLGIGAMAISGLAACETVSTDTAPRVVAVAPHSAAYVPEPAAVEPEQQTSENTPYNQWGGKVPDAKPTTPVDGDGLGEIE